MNPRDSDLPGLLIDALAVVGIAALLVAVHLVVPPGVRNEFALQYSNPDPVHALMAAYVHSSADHLYGNIVGLLAGGAWAIVISHLAGERRWFRFTLLWFLTILPIAVGLSGAVLIEAPLTTRGFSSVVAGFAGYGLIGVGVVLHRTVGVNWWLAWDVTAGLTIVLAAEILWLVSGTIPPMAGAVLALVFGLTLVPIARAAIRSRRLTGGYDWGWVAGGVLTTVISAAVLLVFVGELFPTEIVTGGSVTNILGHYLGLVYGAVIASWGYRYWSVDSGIPRVNRRS